MVGYDLVLPGSCTGELKIHFLLFFSGFFLTVSSKDFEYPFYFCLWGGRTSLWSCKYSILAPFPRKKRMNFPHLPARREHTMSGSSDGLIGESSLQLPRLEEDITPREDITPTPLISRNAIMRPRELSLEWRRVFLLATEQQAFSGGHPSLLTLEFTAEFRSSHSKLWGQNPAQH